MKTRLSRRGVQLTEIGLGAAQFGNLYRVASDDEVHLAVRQAWQDGIRYFDTAPHYGLGLSERRLGRELASRPRGEFVVSTKVGRLLQPSPETAHLQDGGGFAVPASSRRVWDFSRDGIVRSAESSLERLGLDYLDIAYLHDPDDFWVEASTTGIATLIELRDQGVVRSIGAGMNQSAMLAEFVRRTDVDLVMLAGRYTLLEQGALNDLLPIAELRGVGVVAAAVYNSGLLSAATVPDNAAYDYGQAPCELIERARRLAEVCSAHGVTLPEAAIQFPLRHPAVLSVVVGARTAEHVNSNVERYSAEIPSQLWRDLVAEGLIPDQANGARVQEGQR